MPELQAVVVAKIRDAVGMKMFWFCVQVSSVKGGWPSRVHHKEREGRVVEKMGESDREVGSPVWPRRGREGEKHTGAG